MRVIFLRTENCDDDAYMQRIELNSVDSSSVSAGKVWITYSWDESIVL